MYEIFDSSRQRVPIKVWLPGTEKLADNLLAQAQEVANLPFIFKWLALMPDCHYGYGMPIGGVMATKDTIVPNAVGMDIGCGMCYVQTDILYKELDGAQLSGYTLMEHIVNQVMKAIPVGKSQHQEKQPSQVIDQGLAEKLELTEGQEWLTQGYYQIGTLGGGNHFIEFQQDEEGFLGMMLHSGSRNLGAQICTHFNQVAKELNQLWHSELGPKSQLSFLPTKTKEGQAYIKWMNLALDYAFENREVMLEKVQESFSKAIATYLGKTVNYSLKINCHHNYAALEEHYGEMVWVHRKGATRAREGEFGIIPGAMGSRSYLVTGLADPESFHSSAHGAGRIFSRRQAKAEISAESVLHDLTQQSVVLGKTRKSDVAEESRFAYKNIDAVMANQKDLVLPIKKLTTVAVVKG